MKKHGEIFWFATHPKQGTHHRTGALSEFPARQRLLDMEPGTPWDKFEAVGWRIAKFRLTEIETHVDKLLGDKAKACREGQRVTPRR